MSAWVYLTSTAATSNAVGQEAEQQSGFLLRYDQTAGRWAFVRFAGDTGGASPYKAKSNAAPTLNTWTHLAGVFDATTGLMTLYVNGVAQGTATDPAPIASLHSFVIGAGKSNGVAVGTFSGSISDVQAYDKPLSATQVNTVYSGGLPDSGISVHSSATLDDRGLPTSSTDPNGNTTTYSYDEAGHLAVTVAPTVTIESNGSAPAPAHPVTMTGYDTFGAPTEMSDANGNVTTAGYDASGRQVSLTLPSYTLPGTTTTITPVGHRTYDPVGNLLTSTDALNHTVTNTYDQLGRMITTTTPNNGVTQRSYDLNGDVLSVTDPTGAQTQATYDYLGREITQTSIVRQSSTTNTSTMAYNNAGWLATVTTPGSVVTNYTYNALGQKITVSDSLGNTARYAYDGQGRNTTVTAPDGTSRTVAYDGVGRGTTVRSYNSGGVILTSQSATYNANGAVTGLTDARGSTSSFTYDATGMLTAETEPVATGSAITTSFGYDAGGNRTRYTDGRAKDFITTYNSWNFPESQIEPTTPAYPNPADRTTTITYNAVGAPTTQTAPGGVTTTASYDANGNPTSLSGSGAEAATTTRTFGYDLAGRVTSASAPGGTDTFTWDDRGLLLSATGPSGASSFTYTVDALAATRTDAADTTTYTYDTDDRLKSITNPTAGVSETLSYNSLSQPTTIVTGADSRTLGYDPGTHRLTSDTLTAAGGAVMAGITYGYDANGNEVSKTTTGLTGSASNTYTYDQANRLASWNNGTSTTNYAYDAAGNRTQIGSRTLTYDARDRLISSGTTTYTYTARGTLKTTTSGATTTPTTADAFGQTVTQGSATYQYDALGRVTNSGFSYTGLGNTLATDTAAKYVRDPAGQLAAVEAGSTNLYAWTDRHSDVVAEYSGTASALTGSTTYDPLGAVLSTTGMLGNLGYQSGWTDHSTGRVNMSARWYNPETGQFDSQDTAGPGPVPSSAAGNPFAYGADNPLTSTDPSGHACVQRDDDAIVMACYHKPEPAKLPTFDGCHPVKCKTVSQMVGSCPHNPDGSASTFKNCTSLILDNKGGAYINGIHFVAGDLHGIDPYDLAKQIDDVAGLNPTAYINAPILTTIAAIPIAVQRIIDSSAKSSNDAAWSAAGSAVGAIEIGGPGGSAVGQFAAEHSTKPSVLRTVWHKP